MPEFVKYFETLNDSHFPAPLTIARSAGRFAMNLTQMFVDGGHAIVGNRTYSGLEMSSDYNPVNHCMSRYKMLQTLDGLIGAEDRPSEVVIAFADIQGLKEINDTKGHHVGDKVLEASGWCMRQIFRPKDKTRNESCVGSWGGDEFILVMLPGDGTHDSNLEYTLDVKEDDNGKSGILTWNIEQYLKNINEYEEVLGIENALQSLVDNGITAINCWYVFDAISVGHDSNAKSLIRDFAVSNMTLLKTGKTTHFREF